MLDTAARAVDLDLQRGQGIRRAGDAVPDAELVLHGVVPIQARHLINERVHGLLGDLPVELDLAGLVLDFD